MFEGTFSAKELTTDKSKALLDLSLNSDKALIK